ncbi:MAG: hypothetical protein ABI876_06550 [Bacteroidota bacterium]
MLCPTDGIELGPGYLGPLNLERMLFEFEGPRSYTALDNEGELLYLHQCGESGDTWQYFVVPFSESLLSDLEEGRIDLRTALEQPRLWIANIGADGVKNVVRVGNRIAIANYLPVSGTMLYPELEPLLSVRSIGEGLELENATLGLLHTVLENIREALKILAEFAIGDNQKLGQPRKATRRYYDLPVTLQSGSIRVNVFQPSNVQEANFETDDVWRRMELLLQRGLAEISRFEEPDFKTADDDLRVAMQAVQKLAPSTNGVVEKIEISGRLASRIDSFTPIEITREKAVALRKRLRRGSESQPSLVTKQGYISELDRDGATCMLRDNNGTTILKLSFAEQFFDEVKESFDSEQRVEIVAEITPPITMNNLLALTFLPD